jgi:hypothetical protein
VMEHVVAKKKDETRRRWDAAIKDANFDCIRNVLVVETRPEHFDKALADGKVSSNVYLRRIHNHALGMKWLLKSVISRLQWPKPVFKDKRAITADEHAAIVARELNMERRDFYELLWHTGAAQSDGACLRAEDINWNTRTISFTRKKLKSRGTNIQPTLFRFSADVEVILKRLSDGRVALSRSMELGDKRAAATSSRIRIAAPITSAPRNRAQPETALGFVFTAWHDFAELAAYSSTAIRSRLPDFARIVTLEGDEPLSAVLAGSRTGLSGLRNGRAMAETTFCSAQVTAR